MGLESRGVEPVLGLVKGGCTGMGDLMGWVNVLELVFETFNNKGGQGELGISAKRCWETLDFEEGGMKFPGKRSVSGLQPSTTGM